MPTIEAEQSLNTPPVRVAVGIITRDATVCLSLRPKHLHQGGLWEFPGGKIEPGETVGEALSRELFEELGLRNLTTQPFMNINWQYADKSVQLEVEQVVDFDGQPSGLEGQQVKWVAIADLHSYRFPEANAAIVQRLQQL